MFIECPKCKEEIEVVDIQYSSQTWSEPEHFEYDFAEDHECQATWSDEEQKQFDHKVYSRLFETRYRDEE